MVNLINCQHAVCKDCFVDHYSMMIRGKSIKYFNCLVCWEPDMSSDDVDLDLYLQVFSGLIRNYLNKDLYDLYMKRLNDHTMQKDPNFCWCAHVSE